MINRESNIYIYREEFKQAALITEKIGTKFNKMMKKKSLNKYFTTIKYS